MNFSEIVQIVESNFFKKYTLEVANFFEQNGLTKEPYSEYLDWFYDNFNMKDVSEPLPKNEVTTFKTIVDWYESQKRKPVELKGKNWDAVLKAMQL